MIVCMFPWDDLSQGLPLIRVIGCSMSDVYFFFQLWNTRGYVHMYVLKSYIYIGYLEKSFGLLLLLATSYSNSPELKQLWVRSINLKGE